MAEVEPGLLARHHGGVSRHTHKLVGLLGATHSQSVSLACCGSYPSACATVAVLAVSLSLTIPRLDSHSASCCVGAASDVWALWCVVAIVASASWEGALVVFCVRQLFAGNSL